MKFSFTIVFLFLFLLDSCSKSEIHINDNMIKDISIIDNENSSNIVSYIPEIATNLLYLKLDSKTMIAI
ncbi:hypothetical protein D1632_08715 [Chryseobacterium nematophagum]|uniref:Uncharacterized protein n=1 Tax=Chryseobacterium nematophagum TaxID=2305228 RepID=A0A3M7LDY1_9FLAO|nr:hypothetical protein D1632_08715 [Chryseobacterium nematophagum]